MVDRKRKGETITMPQAGEQREAPTDLMAALERTLDELHAGTGARRS